MKLKKIKKSKHSNSGKSKIVTTFMTDGVFSQELSKETEPSDSKYKAKKVIEEELEYTAQEAFDFNAYRLIKEEKQEKEVREKKDKDLKEAIRKENFLNSTITNGIKFSEIYEDVQNLINNSCDYTSFSNLEIALTCLHFAKVVEIKFNDNNKPVVVDGEVLKSLSEDKFFVAVNNKLVLSIECDNEAFNGYYFDTNYRHYDFKINIL